MMTLARTYIEGSLLSCVLAGSMMKVVLGFFRLAILTC